MGGRVLKRSERSALRLSTAPPWLVPVRPFRAWFFFPMALKTPFLITSCRILYYRGINHPEMNYYRYSPVDACILSINTGGVLNSGFLAVIVDHNILSIVVTGVPKYTPQPRRQRRSQSLLYQLSLLVCYTLQLSASP